MQKRPAVLEVPFWWEGQTCTGPRGPENCSRAAARVVGGGASEEVTSV